jgi:hypothetical protein
MPVCAQERAGLPIPALPSHRSYGGKGGTSTRAKTAPAVAAARASSEVTPRLTGPRFVG